MKTESQLDRMLFSGEGLERHSNLRRWTKGKTGSSPVQMEARIFVQLAAQIVTPNFLRNPVRFEITSTRDRDGRSRRPQKDVGR
jgi:hypothetical protein